MEDIVEIRYAPALYAQLNEEIYIYWFLGYSKIFKFCALIVVCINILKLVSYTVLSK